jgi:hypothetical protein
MDKITVSFSHADRLALLQGLHDFEGGECHSADFIEGNR